MKTLNPLPSPKLISSSKLFAFAAAACTLGSLSPVRAATVANLRAHYKFDESSGTTAFDSSRAVNGFVSISGVDALWQGDSAVGTPDWQPTGGVSGGSIRFSGLSRDYFSVENFNSQADSFGNVPFTLSLWFKTTSAGNGAHVYLGEKTGVNKFYVARTNNGDAQMLARNTTERSITDTLTVRLDDGEWHHMVAVYQGLNNRSLYINGVLMGSSTVSVPTLGLHRLSIGANTRAADPFAGIDLYNGSIDDLQMYNAGLNQNEVSYLYANPGSPIPEPASAGLFALGLATLGFRRRGRS